MTPTKPHAYVPGANNRCATCGGGYAGHKHEGRRTVAEAIRAFHSARPATPTLDDYDNQQEIDPNALNAS